MSDTLSFLVRMVVRKGTICAVLALEAAAFAATPAETLDVIVTHSGTFSNVTVVSMTATHVTIKSAKGAVATLKLMDLNPSTLARLKGEPPPSSPVAARTVTTSGPRPVLEADATDGTVSDIGSEEAQAAVADLLKRFSPAQLGTAVLAAVVGIWLLFWLFYCYCLRLICLKTGNEPGVLVWLPVLQAFPMLRAAGMSYAWFLALLIPVLNFITSIIWCFKITQSRGKHWALGLLLILPITNILAFLYLAFSSAEEPEDSSPTSTSAPLQFA